MEKDKWEFVNNEILTLSILGGLTRGFSVYKSGVAERHKKEFKDLLRRKLKEYARPYRNKVSSEQHTKNIEKFANEISKEDGGILIGGRFRIGRTQKVLNLYLKYLWVLGQIPEPPHCPFDSIIISKLRLNISFTKFDSIKDYESLVDTARQIVHKENLSIAEWELKLWNRKSIEAQLQ